MSLLQSSLSSLRRQLVAREISPADLVRATATAIEARNGDLGAYLSWDTDAALKEAEKADVSLPLGGIPLGIKDNINVTGQPCTCGSRMLAGSYTAPYDATVIQRLRAAGAIPFGRLNMDEFAMGSSTENSALGVTQNPAAPGHIPGGSSGGSACAVAGGLAVAALGSDTGGSIRQPAALCGCVGLKPTYGRVSRFGLVAFASSLDQIGPLTQSVEDSALLLNHLCGFDPRDSTSLQESVPDFTAAIGRDIRGLRIGLPKEYFISGIDPDVEAVIRRGIATLESLGADLREISLPHTEAGVATYYVLAPAEASANLARFDGVRYGHRAADASDLMQHYLRSRAEGFGPEVKRRILLGTYVLSSGYYDAYYLTAQKARTLIRQDFTRAFEDVDCIVCPTSPTPAHRLGALKDDPLQAYLEDVFTIPANLAGLPAISVPAGTVHQNDADLPVGIQFISRPLDEATLLQVAHAFETAR
ncbi:MAG: Asp-tRNA(Asn)/Glu-tRNA(Gln) amidotransferase subunit GatA [Verrucomicrobiales bacterium]|nr:Asp-tRNA(Asn)/Glu-tRNA(Gln) amidotransferase subunit GatA [Verrucomicrobiales bacterium]